MSLLFIEVYVMDTCVGIESAADKCPICMRVFSHSVIKTDGHVLPEMCREDNVSVTECRDCNSWLGTIADVALNSQVAMYKMAYQELSESQMEKFYKNYVKVKTMNGKEVRVLSCRIVDRRIKIDIAYIDEAPKVEYIDKENYKFNINMEVFYTKQVVGALLHTAVLWAKSCFGLNTVEDKSYELIRKPLINACNHRPDRERAIESFTGYHDLTRLFLQLPYNDGQICLLRDSQMVSIAYVYPIPLRGDVCSLVMLPGTGSIAAKQYQRLIDHLLDDQFVLERTGKCTNDFMSMGQAASSKWYKSKYHESVNAAMLVDGFEFGEADRKVVYNDLNTDTAMPIDFRIRSIKANINKLPKSW